MMILALDLSTRTGWAAGRDHAEPQHGVWDLGSSGNCGRYCSSLASILEGQIHDAKPDLIIMEAPLSPRVLSFIGATEQTARVLIGLAAVAEMIAFEAGVPCEEADVRVARKLAIGTISRRRSAKAVALDWCYAQGWRPADDNAADALVLWRYRHILSRATVAA